MIILRALEPSDIKLLYQWENNADIWQHGETLVPFSRYHLEQYVLTAQNTDIYHAKQVRLMVDIAQTNEADNLLQTVGMVDLFDFNPMHSRAGVGILIAPEFRKENYATEALKALTAYAFGTLKLHQLYCDISVSNIVSLKIFQKNGFTIAGVKKNWLRKDQYTWQDAYILQLINA